MKYLLFGSALISAAIILRVMKFLNPRRDNDRRR